MNEDGQSIDRRARAVATPANISVIIPAYNAEAYLAAAIESVLAQTVVPAEIIVIDDGSRDRTADIAAGFAPRVTLLRKPNGGTSSARNMGAKHASGEWLAMLDADDRWEPAKIERQLALDDDPRIAMLHTLANSSPPHVPVELDFDALCHVNFIINSSVMIRRSIFLDLSGFDETIRISEDYDLWLRVAAAGYRIRLCPEVLTYYTRGIGKSSDAESFSKESLEYLSKMGEKFGVSEERIKHKRAILYESLGRTALFERKMALARMLLFKGFWENPTTSTFKFFAASLLPKSVLDARRDAAARSEQRALEPAIQQWKLDNGPGTRTVKLPGGGPQLLVIVDAEEEFDWLRVPSPSMRVEAMQHQGSAQIIFNRYSIVPTYAVDYAVASQPDGFRPLLRFLDEGRCEIGAQLHPWINPPIREELTERNASSGNLSPGLEAEKLEVLTAAIEQNFGCRPILYRAGRYGLGKETWSTLARMGYRVDCSVRPFHDMYDSYGPDFRFAPTEPYWVDAEHQVLEVPVTVGMAGLLAPYGRELFPMIASRPGRAVRLPGILARLGLLDRIQLTPEGISLAEAKRLTRARLAADPNQLFVVSYHSPSLQPGNTPYVRSADDLRKFLRWLEQYFEFFFNEIGGRPTTPAAFLKLISAPGTCS